MKYNLGVLNDREFEDLCKDLLDLEFGVEFQIFKTGKDGGIDLLYSGKVENEIVVQVKHYEKSPFSLLLNRLSTTEKHSIDKMDPLPLRYIVMTSLGLSPQNSREIKVKMEPYIASTRDIYGRQRIEALIARHRSVEEKCFKLWLTSTNVLERILNNSSAVNSEFYKAKILSRASLYVANGNYGTAMKKLQEHRFLIISGAPGVGKTTLAFILVYEKLAKDYELIYCDGKISEVDGRISEDPERKQIFMVDDFLGANLYDINNPKNPENKITSFIGKIQHLKNKLLILTTRTTILNHANYRFESLKRSGVTEMSKYELKLSDYSLVEKARILYNHLYFSSLSETFVDTFFKKENYTAIIQHPNYFPRTIEFITDEKRYLNEIHLSVKDFIFQKLDHPEEIWGFAYEQQLGLEDKLLIMTLFTLGGNGTREDLLEDAFESRYNYEIKHSNVTRKSKAFRNSLRKLLDGFIKSSQNGVTGVNSYHFLNPSILDFLLGYLKTDAIEKHNILHSVVFIEQISTYFGSTPGSKILLDGKLRKLFFPHLLNIASEIRSIEEKVSVPLEYLYFCETTFGEELSQHQAEIINKLGEILSDSTFVDSLKLSILMEVFANEELDEVNEFVISNLDDLVNIIIANANDEDSLGSLTSVFSSYKKDFLEYLERDDHKLDLTYALSRIFEQKIGDIDFGDDNLAQDIDYMGKEYAVAKVEDKTWEEYNKFVQALCLDKYYDDLDHNLDFNAEEIVESALERSRISYLDDYKDYKNISSSSSADPWMEIDRMFQRK